MIKNSATTGFILKFAEMLAKNGVIFVVGLILARKLNVSDYGIVAIAMPFISALSVITTSGLPDALIQRKECDEQEYSAVFWLNTIVSCVLVLIVTICAPFLSRFYKHAELLRIIPILALTMITNAIFSIIRAKLYREANYALTSISVFISSVVSGIIGIMLAMTGYSYWALVFQTVSSSVIGCLILLIFGHGLPQRTMSLSRAAPFASFGWKIMIASIAESLSASFQSMVIGKGYTTDDLGYYSKGKSTTNTVVGSINNALLQMLLPYYALSQNDTGQLKDNLSKALRCILYFVTPIAAGISIVSKELVVTLYGEKWLISASFVSIFAAQSLIMSMHYILISTLSAIGKSGVTLKITLLYLSIQIALTFVSVQLGIMYIAMSTTVAAVLVVLADLYYVHRYIGYGYLDWIKDLYPIALYSLMMGLTVILFKNTIILENVFWSLIGQVVTGVCAYLIISLIFKPMGYRYGKNWLLEKLRIGRGRR